MGSRLHTTLVYFGIVRDPELEARLDDEPIRGCRAVAVGIASVLMAIVAVAVIL